MSSRPVWVTRQDLLRKKSGEGGRERGKEREGRREEGGTEIRKEGERGREDKGCRRRRARRNIKSG